MEGEGEERTHNMRDHPALVQLLYKTPAQALDLRAVRVGDDDVDVVAFRLTSSVPAYAQMAVSKGRGVPIGSEKSRDRTNPPAMVETQPGSSSSSSRVTTRPISSTSARGILGCTRVSLVTSAKHDGMRNDATRSVLLCQVLPESERDADPALAQAVRVVAPRVRVLPALPRRLAARLLFDLNDQRLLSPCDVFWLDPVVHLEVGEGAQAEAVQAQGGRGPDAVYRAEEGEGVEAV